MSTYTLVVYIQPSILDDLGNLTFARTVNGVSNVIFQCKTSDELGARNTLQWVESYQIGATQSLVDGALVNVGTTLQDIKPGYVCDWGSSEKDMPPETPAPSSFPTGSFGTIDLPSKWKNTIWCSTGPGNNNYNCIYADVKPKTGLNNRSYIVANTFILSWEDSSASESVLVKDWSSPWSLAYNDDETTKYISWGLGEDGKGEAKWWSYLSDPGKHDPSKANGNDLSAIPRGLSSPANYGSAIAVRCSNESNTMLSAYAMQMYADKLKAYLEQAKPSYMDLSFDNTVPRTSLFISARLDMTSPVLDLIAGCSLQHKTLKALQGLFTTLAIDYVPLSQDFVLDPMAPLGQLEPPGVSITANSFTGGCHVTTGNTVPSWSTIVAAMKKSLIASSLSPGTPKYDNKKVIMDMTFTSTDKISLDDAKKAWKTAFAAIPDADRAPLTIDPASINANLEENGINGA